MLCFIFGHRHLFSMSSSLRRTLVQQIFMENISTHRDIETSTHRDIGEKKTHKLLLPQNPILLCVLKNNMRMILHSDIEEKKTHKLLLPQNPMLLCVSKNNMRMILHSDIGEKNT